MTRNYTDHIITTSNRRLVLINQLLEQAVSNPSDADRERIRNEWYAMAKRANMVRRQAA